MEASSLLDDAPSTPPPRTPPLESLSSTSRLNNNIQSISRCTPTAGTIDDSSTQQSLTISRDGDEKLLSRVSIQTNDQISSLDNQHDSSIKLKRCRHGRIVIKDLSKKKLPTQQSDNGENTITNKDGGNESNNNHIINSDNPVNDNGTTNKLNQTTVIQRLDSLDSESHCEPSKPNPVHSRPRVQPSTPSPSRPNEPSHNTGVVDDPISLSKDLDKRNSSRLVLRAKAGRRSSSNSLSPTPRVPRSTRKSPRRSRYSRSPKSDRDSRSSSGSRERRRSSRRTYNSPSPRRRDHNSPYRRRRRGRRRSANRRHRKTPDRSRRSNIQRDYGESLARSPSRKLPRSRSITPHRERSISRRTNQPRRSVSRGPSRHEKFPHAGHEREREQYDKITSERSPTNHSLRTVAPESAAVKSYISSKQNVQENLPISKHSVAQSTKSSLARVIETNLTPQRLPPEQAQETETSPGASPLAPSPNTPPFDDDSASSDIYDPEAPIIPISPCDSPPLSPMVDIEPSRNKSGVSNNEKNGEDDVPSSAVQLNQQEKYLQKLNRQERVIEEVKVALRPFYQKRSINKGQYKDVLRRAVPKICHSKNGEINPIKIRALVDAYVKKMKRH